ncbi:MAG TPA: FAD-binding oxidoreductase [Streptosporangiaceae bacterium]|jgi:glycine/D-amino acid oxidase-like deaminating enzyme
MTGATADVLVIGAGVIGAATAFHLTRLGAGQVTVLERGGVAAGMSSRSSALVRMHYTFAPEVDLAVRSDQMFAGWTDLTGAPPVVRRTGFVRIVRPGEEDSLRANVAMQRAHGAQAEVIDAAALRELAPGLRADDVTCAAWEPDGGYGDGAIVAGDLLAAARAAGAGYRPGTAVRSLIRSGDRVTGVQTDSGVVHAGTVVLAAGVWAPALAATAGITLPIETELHHVAVCAHPAGHGASVACIDSVTGTYLRPEAGATMTLVGGFTGPRGADPDSVSDRASAADVAGLVEAAAYRVPALADAGIARGVTGVYDMTPDARPLLGAWPGVSGLVIAAGFSGMGFKISPATGEAVAAFIISGGGSAGRSAGRPDTARPGAAGAPAGSGARSGHPGQGPAGSGPAERGSAGPVDLGPDGPFAPGRFAAGRPVTPPFPYSDD